VENGAVVQQENAAEDAKPEEEGEESDSAPAGDEQGEQSAQESGEDSETETGTESEVDAAGHGADGARMPNGQTLSRGESQLTVATKKQKKRIRSKTTEELS
jgi:hypothetical protein